MHEDLIAHDAPAGREQKLVEARMRADGSHQRGHMHCTGALAGDFDVIDVSVIAHLELKHRVHLVLARARTDMAFEQHGARAVFDHDERADENRRRLAAGIHEYDMDRLRQRGALRHVDQRAVAHEGGVERNRDVVGRHDLAEMSEQVAIAGRQRLRHGANGEAGLEASEIGEFRHESAVDEYDAAGVDGGKLSEELLGAGLGGRIGHARERLCLPHERPQIRVFPFFDAPMRQTLGLETAERVLAQRADRRGARKRTLGGGKVRRQHGLGRSLDRTYLGVHRKLHAISSWY
jgi:hypothetical protein